mgnify:CR=1 FL=1
MAITEHGEAEYVFGWDDTDAAAIATATGLRPQTLKISGAPEYIAHAEDEDGLKAAKAVANDARTFTMNGYLINKASFEAAKSFTFETRYYIIEGRDMDVESKEYRKASFTGSQNDGITAAIAP